MQEHPAEPDEQHVAETDATQLAREDRLEQLQSEPPEDEPATARHAEAGGTDTLADVDAGGGTTADPGRQNPIIPGEGRL